MLKLKQIKKPTNKLPTKYNNRDSYFKPNEFYKSVLNLKNYYEPLIFNGTKIKFKTTRMSLIKREIYHTGKCKCNICGLEPEYGSIMKYSTTNYTIHLFATKNGEEVFFNVDHIIPKSKNGKNTIDNLQITCSICNSEKADSLPKEIIIPQRTNVIVDEKVIKQTKPVSSLKIIGGYYFGKVC